MTYRIYISDTLYNVASGIFAMLKVEYKPPHYYDVVYGEEKKNSKKEQPEETRTPDEIIDFMQEKISRW